VNQIPKLTRLYLTGLYLTGLSLLSLATPYAAYGTSHPFEVGGDPSVDPSQFRITTFASGLSNPLGMQVLSDGSILVTNDPGQLVRFVDMNQDGIADGPGQVLANLPHDRPTSVRFAGDLVIVNSLEFGQGRINVLRQGATPADPYTDIGTIEFDYNTNAPGGRWHASHTLAVRPKAGQADVYDVFFNLGSTGDTGASPLGATAILSGLLSGEVVSDAIHMFTIDNSGAAPTFGSLTQVASGVRNPGGITFDPSNGDLYFSDNGSSNVADELNRIAAADIGGSIENFGFPTRLVNYTTGNLTGNGQGFVDPVVAFTLENGLDIAGASEVIFAPEQFPEGLNQGVFVGFFGRFGSTGSANDANAVAYANPATGEYFPFIDVFQNNVGHPIGLATTSDSLFVADFQSGGNGAIYQIQAIPASGDFDNDGDVDGADFLAWQRDTSLGSLADWESSIGSLGALATSQSVPEPTTWLLLLVGAVSAILAKRDLMLRRPRCAMACLAVIAFAIALTTTAHADTHASIFDVELDGIQFIYNGVSNTRIDLTIQRGDTVRWTWLSGFHNVRSGDHGSGGSIFSSGDATDTVGTTFEYTFNDLGVFPYHCGPHEVVGMVSSVTVVPEPSTLAGLLTLAGMSMAGRRRAAR